MRKYDPGQSGRHFLQIPGPTNVPDRILRAIDRPSIDHRSSEFAQLATECLEGLKTVFHCTGPVIIYPASGTGAWEAALVNILSPGDRILMFETGHFATLWRKMAERFGIAVDFVPGDWRHGIDPAVVESRLSEDKEHAIKAVACVHNETSTGVTSRIAEVRSAMDATDHPALLLVDTVSSLGSIDYRQDEWGVDVAMAGSQKGLMLPPGLSFNAISAKALDASRAAKLPKLYWSWEKMLSSNRSGFFPYTPSTNLLYGLREAIEMLVQEEGLENAFRRHARHGEAARQAVRAWGLELVCLDPREHSNSLTAVLLPDGHSEVQLRQVILEHFDLSLGSGLGKLADKVFRIGHLGSFNDLMLCGTLSGVEMGLERAGIPFRKGGVAAAMDYLNCTPRA
jgi:alanine-glyoxylate transaminase/serine-glyoxylate transaminase/serine-pyruvate transaminase